MEIRAEDLQDMVQVMRSKLNAGYRWLEYKSDSDVLQPENIKFYRKFTEAEKTGDRKTVRLELMYNIAQRELNNINSETSIEINLDTMSVLDERFAFNQQRWEDLAMKLMRWGIPDDLTPIFEKTLSGSSEYPMNLQIRVMVGSDKLKSSIFIYPSPSGFYEFDSFSSSLTKRIEIPDLFIHGISCKKLDKEMQVAFGQSESALLSLLNQDSGRKIIDEAVRFASILDDLSASQEGRKVAEKLMAKYWMETPMEGLIPDPHKLEKKYVIKQNFDKLGEKIITHREAYNLMCERYVSKPVMEDGILVEPWYYRHNGPGPSFANLVRIENSEHLNISAHVERLVNDGFVLESSTEEFVKTLRRGDDFKIEQVRDGYKQMHSGYFNPFLNEVELTIIGPKTKIDQSKDLGNDLGMGKKI